MYYSTKIFTTAGAGIKDSFSASAVIGLVNLVFTFVAMAFVDRAGRRKLLLTGLAGQVIALSCVGWMFHTHSHGPALLAAIVAFIASFAMALGPVPWIICSEIFPTQMRGRAMSVATFAIWASCYAVAQTFPPPERPSRHRPRPDVLDLWRVQPGGVRFRRRPGAGNQGPQPRGAGPILPRPAPSQAEGEES